MSVTCILSPVFYLNALYFRGEEAIGVACTVNVESDELTFIIEAVDGRCPDAIGVVD